MALIVVFVNKSNLAEISDYTVQVMIGDGTRIGSRTIYRGEITGHNRSDGWLELVSKLVKKESPNAADTELAFHLGEERYVKKKSR